MSALSVEVTNGPCTVTGDDDRDDSIDVVHLEKLCQIASRVLCSEGIDGGQLGLHLVDAEAMAVLNLEHMGHDGPTDVLSFPLDLEDDFGEIVGDVVMGQRLLGDIVLCPSVASTQALGHVGTFDGELALLVVHGVLHVLGHDHVEPEETMTMQEKERSYLWELGYDHPVLGPLPTADGAESS
jgi:probable rRNA maturation factor